MTNKLPLNNTDYLTRPDAWYIQPLPRRVGLIERIKNWIREIYE